MRALIFGCLALFSVTSFASDYMCNVMTNSSDSNRIMTTRDLFPSLLIPIKSRDNFIVQRLMEMNKLDNGGLEISIREGIEGDVLVKQEISPDDNGIYFIEAEGIQAVCQKDV